MRSRNHLFGLWIMAILVWGCGHPQETTIHENVVDSADVQPPMKPCGVPELVDVRSTLDHSIGVFEVCNDTSHLYFTYSPPQSFELNEIALYYGHRDSLPRDARGEVDPTRFPLSYPGLKATQPWTTRISFDQLPKCLFIAAFVKVSHPDAQLEGWAAKTKDTLSVHGLEYCRQSCKAAHKNCSLGKPDDRPITFPQDQWSSGPGQQASLLFQQHFGTLFPDGIVLGCNEQAVYASAESALSALPMTGAAGALMAHPKGEPKINNKLAGELLSLMITLRMEESLPDFSPKSQTLADLQVATGAFEGWSVEEVVQEGNNVLGGCTSNYTPAQIHEVVREINQNFANGLAYKNFLRCPEE